MKDKCITPQEGCLYQDTDKKCNSEPVHKCEIVRKEREKRITEACE